MFCQKKVIIFLAGYFSEQVISRPNCYHKKAILKGLLHMWCFLLCLVCSALYKFVEKKVFIKLILIEVSLCYFFYCILYYGYILVQCKILNPIFSFILKWYNYTKCIVHLFAMENVWWYMSHASSLPPGIVTNFACLFRIILEDSDYN